MRQFDRSRRYRITIAACVGALMTLYAVLPACGQGTFKLTFKAYGEDFEPLPDMGDRWNGKVEGVPEKLKGKADVLTDAAMYYIIPIGGPELIAALEPEPLTLVVDTDLDNDLSDETGIEAGDPGEPFRRFGTITVTRTDPKRTDVPLVFRCFLPDGGGAPSLIMAPAGVYRGKATFGDETFDMVLSDTTMNGYPGDIAAPGKDCDSIAFDFDKDDHFYIWDEIMPLSPMINHRDKFYNISVAEDGSTITFAETKPRVGYFKVTGPGVLIRFNSPSGAFRHEVRGDKVPLPVGKHYLYTTQACDWDEKGYRYRVQTLQLPEGTGEFEIKEGETTVFEYGPPLKIKTNPVREGENIVVNVEVWGSYGERYFPYCLTDGGHLEGGGLSILDEKGEELASGHFEWG